MISSNKEQKLTELKIKLSVFSDIVNLLATTNQFDLHKHLQNYLNNLHQEIENLDLPEVK